MEHPKCDVWPPPPNIPDPPDQDPRWLDAMVGDLALGLAAAGMLCALMDVAWGLWQGPHAHTPDAEPSLLTVLGGVLDLAALVAGVDGRKSLSGKMGLMLGLLGILVQIAALA